MGKFRWTDPTSLQVSNEAPGQNPIDITEVVDVSLLCYITGGFSGCKDMISLELKTSGCFECKALGVGSTRQWWEWRFQGDGEKQLGDLLRKR